MKVTQHSMAIAGSKELPVKWRMAPRDVDSDRNTSSDIAGVFNHCHVNSHLTHFCVIILTTRLPKYRVHVPGAVLAGHQVWLVGRIN